MLQTNSIKNKYFCMLGWRIDFGLWLVISCLTADSGCLFRTPLLFCSTIRFACQWMLLPEAVKVELGGGCSALVQRCYSVSLFFIWDPEDLPPLPTQNCTRLLSCINVITFIWTLIDAALIICSSDLPSFPSYFNTIICFISALIWCPD